MGLTIREFIDYYWQYLHVYKINNNVDSDVESSDSERDTDYDEEELKYME